MDYSKTSAEIQNEMLNEIDDTYEKTKGYFLWDILKAVAIGIKGIFSDLQTLAYKLDIERLEGESLEKYIYQRTALERKQANKATGIITVYGNGTINTGDIFATEGDIKFIATEDKQIIGQGTITAECSGAGVIGNVPVGTVTVMPITIDGITDCNNTIAFSGGYEAETDNDLRQRYYEKLRIPATSGNKYHYIMWAKEVTGVGEARCIPLWNGDNTVKIVILNSDRTEAAEDLIKKVQNYIDPNSTGKGEGVAPIGAICTVVSAKPETINVTATLTLAPEVSVADIQGTIEDNITAYLKGIAFKQDYASYAQIGAIILNCTGVRDYTDLKLNDIYGNIECGFDEVMVLGEVNLFD